MLRYLVLFCVALCLNSHQAFSSQGPQPDPDKMLYAGFKYNEIFNQTKILSQHRDVLNAEGVTFSSSQEDIPEQSWWASTINTITCGCLCKPTKYKIDSPRDEKESKEIAIDIMPSISSSQLDDLLVADFLTKKKSAMKRALRLPCFSLCVDSATMYTAIKATPSDMGQGIASFVLFAIIGENVKQFSRAAYNIWLDPLADPLHKHELNYAKLKRFLPQTLQERIESHLSVARKTDMALDGCVHYLDFALNIPLKDARLTPFDEKAFQAQIAFYQDSKSLSQPIQYGIINHCLRYTPKAGTLETPRTVVYLEGAPGIGKTHLIKSIAKMLGLPLIELRVPEGGTDAFIGSNEKPGTFLTAIKNKPRNAIILIDEMDRALKDEKVLATFLPFLEPSTTSVSLPYLGAEIDVSHFAIFAAGNAPIKDDALRSRLRYVQMGDLTQDAKSQVLMNNIPEPYKKTLEAQVRTLVAQNEKEIGVRNLLLQLNDMINAVIWKQQQK